MEPRATFLPSLQVLRAIAALGVIGCHLTIIGGVPGWLWVGVAGVDLFFVISGFIIAWTYDGTDPPRRYAHARATRIYPTYWIVLALTLANYAVRTTRTGQPPPYLAHGNDWWAIGRSIVLYDQEFQVKVVDVAWTLTYEVLFYAFYLLRFVVPGWLFAALSASWVSAIAAGYYGQWAVAAQHPVLFQVKIVEFHAGMLTAWLARRLPATRTGLWFGITSAFCAWMAYVTAHARVEPLAMVRNWTLPFALLVLTGVLYDRGGQRWYPRWLLQLGAASYSLYLTHALVMDFVVGFTWQRPAMLFALALLVGYSFYVVVERPLVRALCPRRATSPHWQHQ